MAVFLFLFALVVLASAQQDCPNGAVWDTTMNGCLLGMSDKTFYAAEMTCIQQGGHLVSIANAFQNSAVLSIVKANFCCGVWIGMDQSGFWQDGTKEGYTNWAPGQPAKDFRCAQMDQSQNGQWISLNCSQSTDFICNIPARNPVKCTPGWEYFAKTNACYKNMHDHPNIDWPTADSRCKAFGAQLASIHSREENHFLTILASSSLSRMDLEDQTWIGMKSVKNGTGFNLSWSDGSAINYTNMAPGEPNGQNEDCILMVTDFNFYQRSQLSQWYNHVCPTKMNSYMCKMKAK